MEAENIKSNASENGKLRLITLDAGLPVTADCCKIPITLTIRNATCTTASTLVKSAEIVVRQGGNASIWVLVEAVGRYRIAEKLAFHESLNDNSKTAILRGFDDGSDICRPRLHSKVLHRAILHLTNSLLQLCEAESSELLDTLVNNLAKCR